jgi:hypothetical protein
MLQQFRKPFDRMVANAAEHIAEPGKRIDPDKFTRSDEAAENSHYPAAVVAPEEDPVVTIHCETSRETLQCGNQVARQVHVLQPSFVCSLSIRSPRLALRQSGKDATTYAASVMRSNRFTGYKDGL